MSVLYLTGSSGALGQVIRDHYLRHGWTVAGFSRSEAPHEHPQYRFFDCDAANEESVSAAFDRARSALGAPRALIATVGGVRSWKEVAETSIEDFRALLDLNLVTFFFAAKHAMRLFDREGSILSIGAEAALTPSPRRGAYAASKAAMISLTRTLAEEGKSRGVSANVIVPNTIRTKANEEWGGAEDIPKWTAPEDIAALCYHLTSQAGHSINGSVIRIPNAL